MAESKEENVTKRTESEEKLLKECETLEKGKRIHKDWAKKYYQLTMGSMFGEDLASILVDHMKADENDMIDIEGVMAPFSVEHWPRKVLSGVVDLLENSQQLHKDYKNMLATVLEIEKEEIDLVSNDSIQKAVKFIKEQLKSKSPNEDVSSSELLTAFQSQCHVLEDCELGPEDEQHQLVLGEQSENNSQ